MNNRLKTITGLLGLSLLAACSEWDAHTALSDDNIDRNALEVIQNDPDLSIFARMIDRSGYDTVLTEYAACTVFAPVNAAWSGVDTSDLSLVRGIVGSMITSLKFRASNVAFTGRMLTVNGKSMVYDASTQTFEDAVIVNADLLSSNGYIHKVDRVVRRKDNIWEYLNKQSGFQQLTDLTSMTRRIMDTERSIALGVNEQGLIVYDTVWTENNPFLNLYPLNDEDSTYTYVVVSNAAYESMKSKYAPYFTTSNAAMSDSLVRINLCMDYLIRGEAEAIENRSVTDVRIPLDASTVVNKVECSNGTVYLVDAAPIRMTDKIRTVRIEGENFTRCMNNSYLYKRYKRWASGNYDVMLNGTTVYEMMTFATGSGNLFNGINYWIELKAPVYNTRYKIRYVAYDDMGASFESFQLTQKLFVSLPGKPVLSKKTGTSINGIGNNFRGDTCFVGQTYCGFEAPYLTDLSLWSLTDPDNQYVGTKLTAPDSDVLDVTNGGEYGALTMWLCNTAYKNYAQAGPMFLDYIELVPQINE